MCEDKSTRELVIRELPSQTGSVSVVLNPDQVSARKTGGVRIHEVRSCDCLVCQLARAEEKIDLLENAIVMAGSIMHVTEEAVEKLRALVTVDNPYLEQLLRDCLVCHPVKAEEKIEKIIPKVVRPRRIDEHHYFECKECGANLFGDENYCYRCGAKLDWDGGAI